MARETVYATPSRPQTARLLWRGTLIAESGLRLHGVAFVACPKDEGRSPESTRPGLFRNLSQSSNSQSMVQNPPDNPFAPQISNVFNPAKTPEQEDADLCLGLEVMRHRDLHIQSVVDLGGGRLSTALTNGKKRKRGSNKALLSKMESLQKGRPAMTEIAECQTIDAKVCLDARCSNTTTGSSHKVNGDKRCPSGLLFTLGDTLDDSSTFIIYGSLIPTTQIIQLQLARRKIPTKATKPRPDDPLPRTTLFTDKLLRRSSIMEAPGSPSPKTRKDKGRILHGASTDEEDDSANGKMLTEGIATAKTARNPFAKSKTTVSKKEKREEPATPGKGRSAAANSKRRKLADPVQNPTDSAATTKPPIKRKASREKVPQIKTAKIAKVAKTPLHTKNLVAISRMVASCVAKYGIPKTDTEYTPLIRMVCRGVEFAVRHAIESTELIGQEITDLAMQHLAMYVQTSLPP